MLVSYEMLTIQRSKLKLNVVKVSNSALSRGAASLAEISIIGGG